MVVKKSQKKSKKKAVKQSKPKHDGYFCPTCNFSWKVPDKEKGTITRAWCVKCYKEMDAKDE